MPLDQRHKHTSHQHSLTALAHLVSAIHLITIVLVIVIKSIIPEHLKKSKPPCIEKQRTVWTMRRVLLFVCISQGGQIPGKGGCLGPGRPLQFLREEERE